MKKLLAVDGNSLVNRAFYGVKPLTTHDGRNTNAVYGFINMLNHHLETVKPDFAAVAFDMHAKTFRHLQYDFYKANRKGMPPELAEQFEDAKTAAEYLGFHIITCEGFEADDILGTLSTFANNDVQVYLLTGDRDSYQLVGDNVSVLYVTNRETLTIDTAKINEMYNLKPRELIQVKALMGDSSDNIPGVKGIGEKTALELIHDFGTVDKLYEELPDAKYFTAGLRKKLEQGKEMALASRFLAEIKLDAPVGVKLCDLVYQGIDKAELCTLCEKLELYSVIKRLSLRDNDSSASTAEKVVLSCTGTQNMNAITSERLYVFFDMPYEKIYLYTDDNDEAYSLPLNDENISAILCDEKHDVTLHDVKAKMLYLYTLGIEKITAKFFDVMLASYVCDPSAVVTEETLPTVYGSNGVDLNVREQSCILAARNLKKLREEFSETIKEHGQEKLLYEIEFPLALVLADMEHTGFLVDAISLHQYGVKLEYALKSRAENIYGLAGGEFNINSPKQLGDVLFERLHLPAKKKNKSGYSTDADTLEKLREYSPIIDEILEYRMISKLKSTYVDGLEKAIGADGRLHTNFKQALTLTGRLSSADPNLQNIPIRTKEGREIRSVFTAAPGRVLVDADYSQIELRLMAAMSGDENMIRTYERGMDIHMMTASQVFGVPLGEITPELRKRAKAVNFGIIYGISDFSLAGDIKVSKREAAEYIRKYFEKYPKIDAYLDKVRKDAYTDGYVTTLFGRRRYIPELKSRVYMQRMFGERVAMNAPIQGTAADIIKIAMINVYNRLKSENLDAKMILQVHDELIIESTVADSERAKVILTEEMMNAAQLSVPLEVSVSVSSNWA